MGCGLYRRHAQVCHDHVRRQLVAQGHRRPRVGGLPDHLQGVRQADGSILGWSYAASLVFGVHLF